MGVNKFLKAGIEQEETKIENVINEKKSEFTNRTKKSKGGRPTNKEKGLKSRKQYTLTLKEDDYNLFLKNARSQDLSFAKFMEKAAFNYIESLRNFEKQ